MPQTFRNKLMQTPLPLAWRRSRYSFDLLLERRLVLFLWVDGFLVISGMLGALLSDANFDALYPQMVVIPMLILMVAVLANVIALERRSGSLDLALAVPSTEAYFLRRVVPVIVFFTLQGWLLVHASLLIQGAWRETVTQHPVVMAALHLHIVELALLAAAVVLFWASRLTSSGGVILGSALTLVLLWRWMIPTLLTSGAGSSDFFFLGIPRYALENAWQFLVLFLTAVIFYVYARERLRRPEKMLA